MTKIESEKIDCLHRTFSQLAPRGKIESVRTHSEVIEQFDSFSLLKLLFLVRNWHCWSRKAFTRQMTPKAEKKILRRQPLFNIAERHEKLYGWSRLYASAQGHTPQNWRCFFAFFESFLWHFNEKQHAGVIFRLSRPVSCKNQENCAGKQWSLHAPLNLSFNSCHIACKASLPVSHRRPLKPGVHWHSPGRVQVAPFRQTGLHMAEGKHKQIKKGKMRSMTSLDRRKEMQMHFHRIGLLISHWNIFWGTCFQRSISLTLPLSLIETSQLELSKRLQTSLNRACPLFLEVERLTFLATSSSVTDWTFTVAGAGARARSTSTSADGWN